MTIAPDINRKAAAPCWSSTGIEVPRAHFGGKRWRGPDRRRRWSCCSRGHRSEPAKAVLATTFAINATERRPPQSP